LVPDQDILQGVDMQGQLETVEAASAGPVL